MRRQFTLPEADVRYLEAAVPLWETLRDPGGTQWLLLHDWPVKHDGFNVDRVVVALQIPPGYPESQIDMAYFYPALERKDGRAIGGLAMQEIDGQSFQRWSRHRTGNAPWRPDEDDVCSHLILVDDWLERALAKP